MCVFNGINVQIVSERQNMPINKQHICLNVNDKHKVCWRYIKSKSNRDKVCDLMPDNEGLASNNKGKKSDVLSKM